MTPILISTIKFTRANIDQVFETIVSSDTVLKDSFEKYIKDEYNDINPERLYYSDIGEISKIIIDKLKKGDTANFDVIFASVENILHNCDPEIENLMVIGLFEDIQNIGGPEINYYTSFDKWLMPLAKSKWDNLIDFWEGIEWRETKKQTNDSNRKFSSS